MKVRFFICLVFIFFDLVNLFVVGIECVVKYMVYGDMFCVIFGWERGYWVFWCSEYVDDICESDDNDEDGEYFVWFVLRMCLGGRVC